MHSYVSWIKDALPVVSQGTFNADNYSLSFGLLRLAREMGWDYTGGPLPIWARAYLGAMGVAGPLVTIFLSRRQSVPMQMSLVGVAAVLFSPLCWSSYLALLLAPLALWIKQNLREEALPTAG